MIADNLGPAVDAFDDYLERVKDSGNVDDLNSLLDHADWLEGKAQEFRQQAQKIWLRRQAVT